MTGPIVLVLRLMAAVLLYAFLGYALWTMWQAIRRSADAVSGYRVPPIRLEVKRRGIRSTVRVFNHSEVIVGRDPLSQVPIEDMSVSARHARLSFHDGHWWLEDLGSTNGTRLNRAKLQLPTVLTNGDEFKCGSARIHISLPSEEERQDPREGARDG